MSHTDLRAQTDSLEQFKKQHTFGDFQAGSDGEDIITCTPIELEALITQQVTAARIDENEQYKKLMYDRNELRDKTHLPKEDHSACVDIFTIDHRLATLQSTLIKKES